MKHTLYIDGKETPFEHGAAGTTDSAMNDLEMAFNVSFSWDTM